MSNIAKVPFFTGMRRMFYAVTPNETSFESQEDAPQIINEATPFFFVFIILEIIISWYKKDDKLRLNDGVTSISAGMFSRLPMILVRSITIEGYVWVYNNYRYTELPWDSAWTWWLTFFGVDLGYYWFHRLAHEVNFMWAFHQTHHSSEDYNFSTALRQSVFQHYTSWVFYLPLALFVPPSIFLVHQELNIIYQFWIHTQYIKSLGPLEYILNTPSHHRVHHGRNPYCIDKNYAGTLIIWDRIFGTFQPEGEEVAYGLTHPLNTFGAFRVQFDVIIYVLQRFVAEKGIINKFKAIFCGPGWAPGKPRTGDIADIPLVENPVKKYDTHIPKWLTVYVMVHFIVFLIQYQELMARHGVLSQISVLIFVGYCFFNLSCFGRIFDQSSDAAYLEMLRCGLFLVGDVVMCQTGFYGQKGYRPNFMYGLNILYIVSIAAWLAELARRTVIVQKKEV